MGSGRPTLFFRRQNVNAWKVSFFGRLPGVCSLPTLLGIDGQVNAMRAWAAGLLLEASRTMS